MAPEERDVARNYAAILGLLALVVSLVEGVMAGGGTEGVLRAAWCQLLAFAALGAVIGWLAERIVADSVHGRIAASLKEPKPKQA